MYNDVLHTKNVSQTKPFYMLLAGSLGSYNNSSLKCEEEEVGVILTLKCVRKSWHAATSISAWSWGVSRFVQGLQVEKECKLRLNANGFFHSIKHLLKIAKGTLPPHQISV